MGPLLLLLFAQTYELKGVVEPAARASISLHSTATPFTTSLMTAANGRFRFSKLDPGTYTVFVFAPGIGEKQTSVDIGPSTSELRIDLSDARRSDREHKVSARVLAIPPKAWAEYNAAEKSLRKSETGEAIAHLEKAVEIAPKFSAAWNHLGTISYKAGKFQEAAERFRRALEADPDSYPPLVNLGGVLLNLNRVSEAWNYNVHAALAHPEDPLANSQLGMTYFALEKWDLAVRYLNEARKLDPGHFSHPQLMLAEIYLRRGQRAQAADVLDEFVRVHQDYSRAEAIRESVRKLRGE